MGREVATAVENSPEKLHSEDTDTKAVHLVSGEAHASRHSLGRGYNPRLMPSIRCTPQAPSCQTHIYTLLKAALKKQTNQEWASYAQCNASYCT